MEKVYKTSRILAIVMIFITSVLIIDFVCNFVGDISNADTLFCETTFYQCSSMLFYYLYYTCISVLPTVLFFCLRKQMAQGSILLTPINMGLISSLICFIFTAIVFALSGDAPYTVLHNYNQNYPIIWEWEYNINTRISSGIWLIAWLIQIVSYFMLIKHFPKGGSQRLATIILGVLMLVLISSDRTLPSANGAFAWYEKNGVLFYYGGSILLSTAYAFFFYAFSRLNQNK